MRFLTKNNHSDIISSGLTYTNIGNRALLRKQLLAEQKGFCAYSERYILQTDSHAIEHFNPDLKGTDEDSYWNWYVCLTWMNEHKPKKLDERFLPILLPYSMDLRRRIHYQNELYQTIEKNDIEANNLIVFLGWNKYEVKNDRDAHIQRVKKLKELCGDDDNLFFAILEEDPVHLSFITAIEHELDIDLSHLIH